MSATVKDWLLKEFANDCSLVINLPSIFMS